MFHDIFFVRITFQSPALDPSQSGKIGIKMALDWSGVHTSWVGLKRHRYGLTNFNKIKWLGFNMFGPTYLLIR
jgi:hypothetical protein